MKDRLTIELGDSIDNIKIIKNFIRKEDIPVLIGYGGHIAYFKQYNKWPENMLVPPNVLDLIKSYEDKMINCAEILYDKRLEKDRSMDFSYRLEGTEVQKHSDNVTSEFSDARQLDTATLTWSGHLSIIAYLNDSFSGGEICFPNQNYEYSPVCGDVIMFPGTDLYPHEVKKFYGDTRITMSIWTRFLDFTGEIINA